MLVLAGVPLAVPDQAIAGFLPSLDGIRELLAGVALGWKQLLTIALPVGDYQALLVPAFVLVLTSTIVALSIALRARWGELGVLPPIALFVAGIAFGPEKVPWPVPWALAMLAVVLLWLVWRRWRKRRESIRLLTRATDGRHERGRRGLRLRRPHPGRRRRPARGGGRGIHRGGVGAAADRGSRRAADHHRAAVRPP